jgi:large subunit ribosomal protein L9
MQVILLERVPKLGDMGEQVRVRDGFARNYLLPQGKALRANKENRARFEAQKADLEERNRERRAQAEAVANRVRGKTFTAIRQAGQTGQLYGSVSTRDIAEVLAGEGVRIERRQVDMTSPIKAIGLHEIQLVLHPEVIVPVTINVARTKDEAERQAKGEDVLAPEREEEEEEEEFEEEETSAPAEAPPGTGEQPR